jgi:outer membrane receptor protein involved in Fe transport
MTGFFAEDRTQLGENWTLEAGGRWDRIDWDIYDLLNPDLEKHKKADSFSPEAGVEYRIFDPLRAYASYAETFKVPDANTLIFETPNLFTPNPDIDPSIAKHWEIGLRYAHPVFGSVRADYFHVATKKEILFNPLTTLNENFDTRRRGVEFADELSLLPGVGVFFNYTYVDAEFDNGRFDGKTVPLVPESTWTVGTALGPWRGWSLVLRATGVDDRFALNDFNNVFPVEDYWTLGARLSYRRGPWEFYVRGENVLGEDYSSFFTSNGATTLNVNPAPRDYFEGGFRLEL